MRNNDRYPSNKHGYIITMKRLFNDEIFTVCHMASNANEAMAIANRHSFDSAKIIEVIDESTGEIVFPESTSYYKTPIRTQRWSNKNLLVSENKKSIMDKDNYSSPYSSTIKTQQNTEDQKNPDSIFSEWFDLILKN